ncbi:TetR/AcrR family transcriptional regulator [Metabacillus fastidiosus]|uniref:TetR/AcrR family transcriptional regulator n=1 Tax=Metabacillus fastidiosus TaxID=1458 RepID=A0ABU6P2T4_9BACI|nr:TetR/AcrR family transcriptional regulator [Metabacillus fastidiosus]MED4403670.1 TetR/AcrR family transcriptional regulator [Metabacillus fastidiosus]MED4463604.1 TetR/AcrR family transcriptional regulator [Metabacillus fastidiosus]
MSKLYSAFEKLSEEKRLLIINVCVQEFAQNGYEKTSTDIITTKAGISKGILFHYFKNKKNLYLYIVDYVVKFLTEKTLQTVKEVKSTDFFDRIKELVLLKHHVTFEYFLESQLLMNVYSNPPIAVKAEVEQLFAKHIEKYGGAEINELYKTRLLNEESLRDGITVEKITNMTLLILEQLVNKYINLYKLGQFDFLKNPEPLIKELDDYIDIIKNGVYK